MKIRVEDLKKRGKELKSVLDEFGRLADRIVNDIDFGSDDTVESNDPKLAAKIKELRERMNDVDQMWQALLATAGGTGVDVVITENERLKFSDFLSTIGIAMLDTQRQLDSESLAYLQENTHNPHVLPSIFRIPKLSAEMKFALEKQTEKEVNLVFFKNQNLAKELHQQSIKFELVSAPPPPQAVAAIQSLTPTVTLVLEPSERQKVLEAGFAAKAENALPDDDSEHDRIVILRVEPGKGFIIFYAATKGRNNVGVWLYSEDIFRCIYKYDKANDKAENSLRNFINKLADQQRNYLA